MKYNQRDANIESEAYNNPFLLYEYCFQVNPK